MTIWFISDTHFDHAKTVEVFRRPDGSPLRAFASVEEMNETIIQRWNEVVQPSDHVYHLGDLTMHRKIAVLKHRVLDRLKGHKRLLLGNHDADVVENYLPWFKKVMSYRVLENIMFSHVPIHPRSLGRFAANVHGHTHHISYPPEQLADRVAPYLNVSVEVIDYRPVSLEQLQEQIKESMMPGIALMGTTSTEVQLSPKVRVALLKDLRAKAQIDQEIKDLEAKKKLIVERVETIREESGMDKFEIDGFSVALVAPVRDVLNQKRLIALGCKAEWLEKATEQVPSKPYTKITAPK